MEKNEFERFEFLDFFKGVAIFLVVLGHVYLKCLGIQTLFFKLITDFHMPFWFMLSGFMAYKLSNRDICLSIKKKTISLLLPFCTCGGLYALGCGEMHQYLCSEFHAGYWFLLSLFLCWIIFIPFLKLLNYIPENKYWIEILVLLIPFWLMSIMGHFVPAKFWIVSTFSMSVSYYRFLVLGFFLGRMVLATEFMPKLRKYYHANVFIACSFAICGGAIFLLPFHDEWTSFVPMTLIQVMLSISVMGIALFYRSHLGKSREIIEYLGRRSLAVYCFHYFVIYHIHICLDSTWIDLSEGVYFFFASFLTILIIVLTLILAMPFYNNKYLKFIFLGKVVI